MDLLNSTQTHLHSSGFQFPSLLQAASLVVLLAGADAGHAAPSGWKLAWADEFNQPGLPDPAKWTYEEGWIRNNEAQYYTKARKENARVENGTLIIESRHEPFPNPRYTAEAAKDSKQARPFADYTSASLTTRGITNWLYGRVEVRAKLPNGRGMWPAIWMLGADRTAGWPACGEIDIMEFVGHEPDTIHGTVHCGKYNHIKKTQKGSRLTVKNPHQDFHVYAIEWDPQRIDFFVDDQKYFTFTNEGSGKEAWPFNTPHYLILNSAIGGAWGGQKGIDDSIFPQQFQVDYVRVYQREAGK